MTFSVKSAVQALDPVCGLWLLARVVEIDTQLSKCLVKWTSYPSEPTVWLPYTSVRLPETKRICKIDRKFWPTQDPKLYQRGDKVVEIRPDGQDGEERHVDENDPWKCQMKCEGRIHRYEHLKGVSQQVKENVVPASAVNSPERVEKETVPSVLAETAVGEKGNPTDTVADQNVSKKRQKRKAAPKTVQVKKKSASYIARGESAGYDAFVATTPMVEDSELVIENATAATVEMVVQAAKDGQAPSVPDDWRLGPVPLTCSADCDVRFKRIEEQLLAYKQDSDAEVAKLREEIEALREEVRVLKERSPFPVPATTDTSVHDPVWGIEETSDIYRAAMESLDNQDIMTTPVRHTQKPERAVLREVVAPQTPQTPDDVTRLSEMPLSDQTMAAIARYGDDRSSIVKYLVKAVFTHEERVSCNSTGKYGYAKLDERKLDKIKRATFLTAPVSAHHVDVEWKRLKSVIDLFNRHYRDRLKKKTLVAF